MKLQIFANKCKPTPIIQAFLPIKLMGFVMDMQVCNIVDAYNLFSADILELSSRAKLASFGYNADRVNAYINGYGAKKLADVKVILLFKNSKLVGLIPYEKAKIDAFFPFRIYQNWVDIFNFVGDPIIDESYSFEVLEYFSEWMQEQKAFIMFNLITDEGMQQELAANFSKLSQKTLIVEQFSSAAIITDLDGEAYYRKSISSKRRSRLNKMKKKLDKIGDCHFRVLNSLHKNPDLDMQKAWINNFLYIENYGWKGDKGSSYLSNKASKTYFKDCALAWFNNQKLVTFEIILDDQVIASLYIMVEKTNDKLIARCQKTTYLERFGFASPGVMLMHYALKYMLDHHKFELIDACTMPDNYVANSFMKQKVNTVSYISAPRGGVYALLLRPILWVEQFRLRSRAGIKAHRLQILRLFVKFSLFKQSSKSSLNLLTSRATENKGL